MKLSDFQATEREPLRDETLRLRTRAVVVGDMAAPVEDAEVDATEDLHFIMNSEQVTARLYMADPTYPGTLAARGLLIFGAEEPSPADERWVQPLHRDGTPKRLPVDSGAAFVASMDVYSELSRIRNDRVGVWELVRPTAVEGTVVRRSGFVMFRAEVSVHDCWMLGDPDGLSAAYVDLRDPK